MTTPLIMAGSLGRPSLPLLKWIADPVILVEPQELELYKAQHPEIDYVVLKESGKGFSYMMNAMVSEAIKRNQRYFVFTDDDVFGLKTRPSLSEKFSRVQNEEARAALRGAVDMAARLEAAQLAISFSGQSWGVKKAYNEPVGSWGVYVCDAFAIKAIGGFDEDLWIFSDWDVSARLIKTGHRVIRTNLITFEHKMRGMEGGADWLYKNQEKVQQACRKLENRFGPEVVKVTWVEAHGQFEVRFRWAALKNN